MAAGDKTRLEALRDRINRPRTGPGQPRTATAPRPTAPRVRTGPTIPPPRAAPPPTPPAASGGRALVPSGGRALTTPGTAVGAPRPGTPPGPRGIPPLNSINAAGGGGNTAARVGSTAVRALGRASGALAAATPTDVGNAENTPEAADLQKRFDEFLRVDAQSDVPQDEESRMQRFQESEDRFAEKVEFDRQQSVQQGLRGRAESPPARGQGFIQNEETGATIDFGGDDPEGERLQDDGRAVRTTPSSSTGLRNRQRSGNAFADIALGFGDATRAAIQEGRGQANRARTQRLREQAIKQLPAQQKAARQAEQDRLKALESDVAAADKFRTNFDSAPTAESKNAVRREAQADLAANGPDSPGGRFAIGQALEALGQTQGGIANAIFGERGPIDFLNSILEGSPSGEFSSAVGLFLSKDGDIMQDVGGGDFTVVTGMDDLPDFERDTFAQILTQVPEELNQ